MRCANSSSVGNDMSAQSNQAWNCGGCNNARRSMKKGIYGVMKVIYEHYLMFSGMNIILMNLNIRNMMMNYTEKGKCCQHKTTLLKISRTK